MIRKKIAMTKTIAQQQKEWEQKQTLKNQLSQFTTPELEQELLHRQNCQFQRLHCTNQAQVYLIKPQQPACFNCQQDVLILSKDH
jgi:hypothetical protein